MHIYTYKCKSISSYMTAVSSSTQYKIESNSNTEQKKTNPEKENYFRNLKSELTIKDCL